MLSSIIQLMSARVSAVGVLVVFIMYQNNPPKVMERQRNLMEYVRQRREVHRVWDSNSLATKFSPKKHIGARGLGFSSIPTVKKDLATH